MDDHWYRRIAITTACSLLTWVPALVWLFGGEDAPRTASAALAVISAMLLCVFIVASALHIYGRRRIS